MNFKVELPLFNQSIPVLNNDEMKTFYGSGVSSVCPAHYLEDLEIALSFGLDKIGYVNA